MDGIVAGRRVKFDTLTVKGTNVWVYYYFIFSKNQAYYLHCR